jgi:hypothetical protein
MAGTLLTSAGVSSKRLAPSYVTWTPEPYQLRGTSFLCGQGAGALWLEPGMRKTSIVLNAFCTLQSTGRARKMLVVAPKKVCELVWAQEAEKWEQFRHLKVTFLHGSKKDGLLHDGADIHLINPEGVEWLVDKFATHPRDWPYDVFCIDELTKFKNAQAERHKAFMGRSKGGIKFPSVLKHSNFRWGLTGTPNPNGYMDLFGQFLILDDGAALGRYITHYRDMYFQADYDGFNYVLQPGADKRIEAKLEPYVFCLDASDYIRLPTEILDVRKIALPSAARKSYDLMRRDHTVELHGVTVEAANTAAAYSKLAQMANGAVYPNEEDGKVLHVHDAKLDALDTLLEELDGKQLLLAYEFNHDLDRLRARYGDRIVFLADAKNGREADLIQKAWNRGEIEILACHPASAGHGLNLQESSAHHIAWMRPCWDLEFWDQCNRRLRRSGNEADHVYVHVFVGADTVDELTLTALGEKDITQVRLRKALMTHMGAEPGGDEPPPWNETEENTPMALQKLTRAGASAAAEGAPAAPKGWGKPGGAAKPASAPEAGPSQEERIDNKLTGGGFSPETSEKAAALGAKEQQAHAPTRSAEADEVEGLKSAFADLQAAVERREAQGQQVNGLGAQLVAGPQPYQVRELCAAAKEAAEAVAVLYPINEGAAIELWETLSGAIATGVAALEPEG